MSIIAVNEVQEGTDSIISRFTRGMTRFFLVETNDATTAKLLAETAPGIPAIFDFYQFDEGTGGTFIVDQTRIVDAIITEAVKGKPTWVRVTVEYVETPVGFGFTDPTQDTPIISISTQETEVPIFFDLGGNPITNSAGVTFDPPITETDYDMVVQININEVDVSLESFMKHVLRFNGKTNSDPWLGILQNQGLMKVAAQRASRGGIFYWATTYQIIVKRATWERQIIDEGYQQLIGNELSPILDLDGRPVTEPRLLQAGVELPIGDTAISLPFTTKQQTDFNVLFDRFGGGAL